MEKRAPKKPAAVKATFDAAGRPILPYSSKINRWTGKPHEHKREKARREKQIA